MIPEATREAHPARRRLWAAAVMPLGALAVLLAALVFVRPADRLRGDGAPPVERLTVERTVLRPGGILLSILNDGPDSVTIAQVTVDDAYWSFTADRGTTLKHLGRTQLTIPYPWVDGEAHAIKLLTSTGAAFEHEVAVATPTPQPDARYFVTFTLIGLYVGVLPVAAGLLWFPFMRRLGRTGLDVLLALTVGLLVFLLVDAMHEGLDAASQLPDSYQGVALFVAGAAAAYLGLEWVGAVLRTRRTHERTAGASGAILALLVAIGIGLHNFGEGLAIGAAFTLGEAALGTLLIVGFTLHNTTEGLAIVAPLARERPPLMMLLRLGLVGGVPTIAGAWLGGLFYSAILGVLFLGLGAGAIAQVVLQISRQIAGPQPIAERLTSGPVLSGLAAGFAVMYVTGMLVG